MSDKGRRVSLRIEFTIHHSAFTILLLCAVALAVMSCGRGSRPNIILVVVDTLRADRVGVYGNPRALTPFIDSLAARGTVFTHAYATTSWTCPSIASLMTSRLPLQHHVVSFASKLADEEVTFAEALQASGYTAGGFSANYRLLKGLGYAQGFQQWRAEFNPNKGERAAELRQHVLDWLDMTQPTAPDQPLLLYLQYMEPHAPYEPDEAFRARFAPPGPDTKDAATLNHDLVSMRWHNLTHDDVAFLASLYDAAVATVDAELQRLFAELEKRRVLENAIIVITADHGEEFWEHGALAHGTNLYNENVRVPLILIAPGYAGGQRIEDNVSLIDVAPTLLDLLGLKREPRFEGRSLVPWLRPQSLSARVRGLWRRPLPAMPVVLQLESTGYGMDVREHSAGMIQRSTKLLLRPGGAPEVYDLEHDPAEKTADPALEAQSPALTQTLESVRADLRSRAGTMAQTVPLDEATREKLRALGYHF